MNEQDVTRLLSGKDQLSPQEKEQILSVVLDTSEATGKRVWAIPLVATSAVICVAAVLFAIYQPAPPMAEFAARGNGTEVADFSFHCSESASDACLGGKLFFDLSQATGFRYFAAFAKSEDDVVYWYFPDTPTGQSMDLNDSPSGVIERSILLTEHVPGKYEIHGIFSKVPLSRPQIKAQFLSPPVS